MHWYRRRWYVLRYRLPQGFGDPIADPGLAGDQDELAVATPCLFPAVQEQADLLCTADEGGGMARAAGRLEAAEALPLAYDAEGQDRLGDTFRDCGSSASRT